jgi:hypothetical protein
MIKPDFSGRFLLFDSTPINQFCWHCHKRGHKTKGDCIKRQSDHGIATDLTLRQQIEDERARPHRHRDMCKDRMQSMPQPCSFQDVPQAFHGAKFALRRSFRLRSSCRMPTRGDGRRSACPRILPLRRENLVEQALPFPSDDLKTTEKPLLRAMRNRGQDARQSLNSRWRDRSSHR